MRGWSAQTAQTVLVMLALAWLFLLFWEQDCLLPLVTDAVDLFHVPAPDRVRGALRNTVYDNRLRVDNAAHSLSALTTILQVFQARDFDRRNASGYPEEKVP